MPVIDPVTRLDALDKAVKLAYPQPTLADGIFRNTPTVKLMLNERAGVGKLQMINKHLKMVEGVSLATRGAVGRRTSAGLIPRGSGEGRDLTFTISPAEYLGTLEIDEEVLNNGDTDLLTKTLTKGVKDMVEDIAVMLNSELTGPGAGVIGTITGAQANHSTRYNAATSDYYYTMAVDDVSFLTTGLAFDILSSDGATTRASGCQLFDTSVLYGAGTITIKSSTAVTGIISGDKIYSQNSSDSDNFLLSLLNQVAAGGSFPLGASDAVDRTDNAYSRLRSMVMDSSKGQGEDIVSQFGTMLTHLAVSAGWQNMAKDADAAGAGAKEVNFCLTNPNVLRQAQEENRGKQCFMEYEVADLGLKTSHIDGVPFIPEPRLNGQALFLNLDSFHLAKQDPYWVTQGSGKGIWKLRDGSLNWEAISRMLLQILCIEPWKQGRIINIQTPLARSAYEYSA